MLEELKFGIGCLIAIAIGVAIMLFFMGNLTFIGFLFVYLAILVAFASVGCPLIAILVMVLYLIIKQFFPLFVVAGIICLLIL